MQTLVSVAETATSQIDMTFNTEEKCYYGVLSMQKILGIADGFPFFVLIRAIDY